MLHAAQGDCKGEDVATVECDTACHCSESKVLIGTCTTIWARSVKGRYRKSGPEGSFGQKIDWPDVAL